MRRSLFIFAVIISAAASAAAGIPNFELNDLQNRSKTYQDLKGEKLTLIDFWATYCHPCIRSIPEFNRIADTYQDRGLRIIGINVDGPRNLSKVKPFVRSMKIKYPVLIDLNSEVMGMLNVSGLPSMILVNSDDEIVFYHTGFKAGDEKEIKLKIEELLKNAD